MKIKTIIILLLFCTHLTAWSQVTPDKNITVTVLSFNILHGATTKGDFNLDVIAQVIKDAGPDLVALQEVDFKTRRAKNYDLATELGWRTKMASIFGKAMAYDGGEYGEAVLTKSSILSSRTVSLPFSPGNEPRAALEVTIVLPSGDTISFVGTHLDHLKNDIDRISQAKKLNEIFSQNRYPTILAGDLNDVPGSTPINILEKIWTPSYDKANPPLTFPSDKPIKTIDYVMYFPKNKWKVIDTKVIQDPIASDHCAYLVTLELIH
ncbi:MAG: endonuclease/exonuclease/phosphatase family protein [Saprospiraceae bacterium]